MGQEDLKELNNLNHFVETKELNVSPAFVVTPNGHKVPTLSPNLSSPSPSNKLDRLSLKIFRTSQMFYPCYSLP